MSLALEFQLLIKLNLIPTIVLKCNISINHHHTKYVKKSYYYYYIIKTIVRKLKIVETNCNSFV